jgi:uncharacterized membrane protein
MVAPNTAEVSLAYLAELRGALSGVPAEVRDGIVSGVQEELESLDSSDAALRITELRDPSFIAAEACSESAAPQEVEQKAARVFA